jgi:tRNA pseudouridine55 synthase
MNGALIIDKPEDWTSHDVVAKLRGILKTRRIGHAGTLDPFATGVLVVCVGVATRLMQFLVGLDKEYIATVRLGFATDTQDLTGKPISSLVSSKGLTAMDIERVLFEFQGEQKQLPPMFSAKKVDGERLHKAARAGREVERQPADINIYSLAIMKDGAINENADGTRDFVMHVKCSSGTYIRTLAHDMGTKLGVGAHLSALRRTAVGHFRIDEAYSLNEVERLSTDGTIETELICPAAALAHLPELLLNAEMLKMLSHGKEIPIQPAVSDSILTYLKSGGQGYVSLCDEKRQLVGVGELTRDNDVVKPKIVLIQP